MTPEAAIYQFLSSFEIPAYAASSTPEQAEYPYLTYNLAIPDYGQEASMQVDLWYYSDSEAQINAKAREMRSRIGLGGIVVLHDDGAIWLKRGNPWCQAVSDQENEMIKRRYINIDLEYLGD